MHQLFATFVALVFSFCHHGAAMHTPDSSALSAAVYAGEGAGSMLTFPDRQHLARGTSDASYAESECSSCQMTTVSYTMR